MSSTQSVTRCAPEIVQQKNFRFEGRHGTLRGYWRLAFHLAGANALEQILVIEENAFVSARK